MAYEHLITADWHGTDVFSAVSGTTRSNTTARTGSYSFLMNSGHYVQIPISSSATTYIGIACYIPTSVSSDVFRIFFREGTTYHIAILPQVNTGVIQAKRGTETGTLLGSGGSVSAGAWTYLGIKVVVNDSTGIVQVYQDGGEILNLTSQDTRNSGTGVIDNLYIVSNINGCYIDDIKVRDDAIPGVGGIYVYVPTGDGADTGWTASAGNRYECVDDAPGTYTDYISTDVATTGTKSTFTHAAMAAAAYDSIACVCSAAVAKLDASGSGNSRAIVKSSASYASGATVALSTTTKYLHVFATVNPSGGGAWDKTAVGAAEPGVETI